MTIFFDHFLQKRTWIQELHSSPGSFKSTGLCFSWENDKEFNFYPAGDMEVVIVTVCLLYSLMCNSTMTVFRTEIADRSNVTGENMLLHATSALPDSL